MRDSGGRGFEFSLQPAAPHPASPTLTLPIHRQLSSRRRRGIWLGRLPSLAFGDQKSNFLLPPRDFAFTNFLQQFGPRRSLRFGLLGLKLRALLGELLLRVRAAV